MSTSEPRLLGKTALVTGGAKRIGRALALALARQGAGVVIHCHRSAAQAQALAEEIRALGVGAWVILADLSVAAQAEALFGQAVQEAGPIDILVNNASIYAQETLWEISAESLHLAMQVHAVAPLVLARCLAAQGRTGHILNMLDTRVTSFDKQHAAYHMSKRTLFTLTRMLALELAPRIAVNAVAPGLILPPEGQDESYLKRLAHTNPMNSHGQCEDVVEAALFLLNSRFVTGQVVFVDGGFHMKGHLYD